MLVFVFLRFTFGLATPLQEPGLFNKVIVNDDLESALAQLQQAIEAHVPGTLSSAAKPAAAAPAAWQQQEQHLEAIQEQQQQPAVEEVPLPLPVPAADLDTAADKVNAGELAAGAGAVPVLAAAAAGTALAIGLGASTPNGMAEQSGSQQEVAVAAVPVAAAPVVPMGLEGATAAGGMAAGGAATTTLLDFGFGAAAGPAVAQKGMPVRQYMDSTVIPVLREGLKALNQVGVAKQQGPEVSGGGVKLGLMWEELLEIYTALFAWQA
jgi:hypothetical protein